MNRKILGPTIFAALVALAAAPVLAQQGRDYDRHHAPKHNIHRGGPAHHAHPKARWRGAGPQHNFYKGGRLPAHYRGRRYIVNDWRARRLSPPPRGYYWVQTGNDFVLAAIATGLIAQIILHN